MTYIGIEQFRPVAANASNAGISAEPTRTGDSIRNLVEAAIEAVDELHVGVVFPGAHGAAQELGVVPSSPEGQVFVSVYMMALKARYPGGVPYDKDYRLTA